MLYHKCNDAPDCECDADSERDSLPARMAHGLCCDVDIVNHCSEFNFNIGGTCEREASEAYEAPIVRFLSIVFANLGYEVRKRGAK